MTGFASAVLVAVALSQAAEAPADDLGLKKHQAPPVENIADRSRPISANVGKGHYTLGTGGGMRIGLSGAGFDSFNFNAGAGGAYFLTDNILIGAGASFYINVFTGGASGGIPLNLSADFVAPINSALFWNVGMRVSPGIGFSSTGPSFGIDLGLRGGLMVFVTNWLAIEPQFIVDINPAGPSFDIGMGWGMRYFF